MSNQLPQNPSPNLASDAVSRPESLVAEIPGARSAPAPGLSASTAMARLLDMDGEVDDTFDPGCTSDKATNTTRPEETLNGSNPRAKGVTDPTTELEPAIGTPAKAVSPTGGCCPGKSSIITDTGTIKAQEKANLILEFIRLCEEDGLSGNQAAFKLGRSAAWFSGIVPKFRRDGIMALMPSVREIGARRELFTDLPDWFLPAAHTFYIWTNRDRHSGSVPEAIRRTISLPHCPPGCVKGILRKLRLTKLPTCPPALREQILARERAGQSMLTEPLMKQIASGRIAVAQFRNPTEAGLTYLNAPGSSMWINDPETNARRFVVSGDIMESDDGSVNFPVCVPWESGGDPCSEKWGVKVGRFQWLPGIDVASRFYLGYAYVCRPRGSYRAEDILTLLRTISRQHGVHKEYRFEKGSWESLRVKDLIRLMGSNLHTVHSPRQKPFIEGGFDTNWTKLSVYFPNCDVGRFMGETEEANELLTRCKKGTENPVKHFPMLADALTAFDTILAERNRTPVHSKLFGSWIPEERLAEQLGRRPMPMLDASTDWMFSPYMREWKVKGYEVSGSVPLFEDWSVEFTFNANFLGQFHGATVRVYFDPTESACQATIVLARDFGNHRAGEVLGVAIQTNEVASYARRVLGFADDPTDIGLKQRRINAAGLRREVRTILGKGKTGQSVSELRSGLGEKIVIENFSGVPQAAPATGNDAQTRASSPCEKAARFDSLLTAKRQAGAANGSDDGHASGAPTPEASRLAAAAEFERRQSLELDIF